MSLSVNLPLSAASGKFLPGFVALTPLLLCFCFQTAGPRPALSEAGPSRPPLAFHAHMRDLRQVMPQNVHRAEYQFTNQGSDLIEIRDVKTSCGCLTDQMPTPLVPPGETGSLNLFIRSANQAPGPRHYTARVIYGPQEDPATEYEAVLSFRLVLPRRSVTLNPRSLIVHVDQESSVSHVVEVTDHRDRPLTVLTASCEAEFVDVELIPVASNSRNARWDGVVSQIRVSIARAPAGKHDCVVRIRTDDPEFSELTLPMIINGDL